LAKRKPVKEIKLDKKDKLAIVRGYLIQYPDYHKYGYNKALRLHIAKKYGIKINEVDISRYIKQVKKEWNEEKNILVTKKEIISAFQNIYETAKRPDIKIKILQEIGKIEGIYIEKIETEDKTKKVDLSKLSEEELLKLQELQKRIYEN